MFDSERQKSSFNTSILANFIHGGEQNKNIFIKNQKMIEQDPILKFDATNIQKSRVELLKIYQSKIIRFREMFPPDNPIYSSMSYYFDQQYPFALHDGMFLLTLRNLCDEKQVEQFLKPAENRQISGCYAQTELGHGSDVQNLMTTATFDESNDCFVINTPQIKAAKWWIGDLGVYATHACVFAQLIIKGKKYGVHSFLVPVRDKNHRPFKGIEVGDIGPKPFYNNKDNGYLIFSNYSIPRTNMLMKYHRVASDGTYSKVGDQKITYATMLRTRAVLTNSCFISISKAIIIIVRYSLARKQFKDKNGEEIPILNYQLQQQKIFPRISETFANLLGTRFLIEMTTKVLQDAKLRNKFDSLKEAHALSSICKVIFGKDALKGIQIIRKSGGGHGYSMYSGLPGLFELAPIVTFEGNLYDYKGENTILLLQVARFLIKNMKIFYKGGRIPSSVSFFSNLKNNDKLRLDIDEYDSLRNPQLLSKLFINDTCQRLKIAARQLSQGIEKGLGQKQAWDQYAGLQLIDAATAYGYYWIFQNFKNQILVVKDQKVSQILTKLLLLYGIDKILQRAISFIETESATANTLKSLNELRLKLFQQIRPDALAIVQSFEYRDEFLFSAIGRSDGKPYEYLLDWSKNKNEVNSPKNSKQLRQLWLTILPKLQKAIPQSKL